jgi:SAM-dependent methyltransferase
MLETMGIKSFMKFLRSVQDAKRESIYHSYLYDKKMSKAFINNYLPKGFQNHGGRLFLDFGCGKGRHVAMLAKSGFSIIGMDIMANDFWKKIPEAQFLIGGDGELRGFKDHSFDLCLAMQVLMYLREDKEVLQEFYRILKDKGYLILQLTNAYNLHTRLTGRSLVHDPKLRRYYTEEGVKNLLEEIGFRIERLWTEKFYAPFFPIVINYFLEILLPPWIEKMISQFTPSRYRGLINVLAQKRKVC